MKNKSFLLAMVLCTVAFASRAHAQLYSLTATDQGEYQQNQSTFVTTHVPTTTSIRAGFDDAGATNDRLFRNFRIFNVPVFSGPLTSGTLNLNLAATGFISSDPNETFSLFDFTGTIADLTTPSGSLSATFADLGSGIVLGTRIISALDQGTTIQIALNAAGLAYVQAHAGGQMAIGGSLTSVTGTSTDQIVFGGDEHPAFAVLELTAVPEPATYGAIGAGLLLIMGVIRRVRNKGEAV